MTKQQQVFEKVEAFQKKHPAMNKNQIFKKLGVAGSAYYKHKNTIAAKPEKKVKRKYVRQVVTGTASASVTPSQVTVIMGTPEQIRAVLQ